MDSKTEVVKCRAGSANSTRKKCSGFTLIELMIVVVILGLLLAIAVPGYREQIRKTRRQDATNTLTALSLAMERYFTEQSPSTYVGATVGSAGIFPDHSPLDGSKEYYRLSITAQTTNAFTIQAAPINNQVGDKCGNLTLTSTGVRGASGTGVTWSQCWE